MRKLASIKQINDIQTIPEADRLELVRVDGWQSVVEKGLYKVGDRVVFIEIDSWGTQ